MEVSFRSIRGFIVIMVIGLSVQFGQAQGSPLLGKFSLSQFEGRVSLFWQIVEGSTCNGIQIYRSTDTINFQRIGYIGGTCGSLDEPVNYTFTDPLPVENTVNYYYLELGTIGISEVLSIEVFSSTNGGYVIRPHPIVDQGSIYFEAPGNDANLLQVFDIEGKVVYSAESADVFFEINTTSLPSGLYPFTISSINSVIIQGSFLVQH